MTVLLGRQSVNESISRRGGSYSGLIPVLRGPKVFWGLLHLPGENSPDPSPCSHGAAPAQPSPSALACFFMLLGLGLRSTSSVSTSAAALHKSRAPWALSSKRASMDSAMTHRVGPSRPGGPREVWGGPRVAGLQTLLTLL